MTSSKNAKKWFLVLGIALFGAILCAIWSISGGFTIMPSGIATAHVSPKTATFPVIVTANTTPTQQKILALLKQEYNDQPAGTKYADGVEESWCADFVSWIMKESGKPLANPHSGGWRIPGTYTLREYYQSAGTFRAKVTGYEPKLGDVALYDNPSPHGQHTNIVIKNDNGRVTTVGGNEGNTISIQTNRLADDPGLVGYGVLE